MPPGGYLVDTNLLLLYVVGSEAPSLIPRHRRLESYSIDDYSALIRVLGNSSHIFVTPNTLTETSNLLGQHGEPERSRLFERLKVIIRDALEIVIASSDASANPAFRRLGLTDAVLLEAASSEIPLLTMDFQLYAAGLAKGQDVAVNFTIYRSLLPP